MKEETSSKKAQKDSNNKQEQAQNLTSSPSIQKNILQNNNTSPEKNLNQKFFPSKENFFGVKTSPTYGVGKTMSSGTHSPILNYYSNVSSDGKEYYYSPKEGINQNSFNSNKISPLNFNYSPSKIFNNPKNNTQSKDLSNNGEDKTLQEKMEPLVNSVNNYHNNFNMRKNSFPSNGSNLQENNNEDNEEEDSEILTLTIDSGEENYLLGMGKDKNLQFNLTEQDKKDNTRKNSINNMPNKSENENKKKNSDKEKNDEINAMQHINTIYNNIQNSYKDNNEMNKNSNNENTINNLNQNNININTNDTNNINNNFNIFNIDNHQNMDQQHSQEENSVENIINKQEFKDYVPNRFRKQFQEEDGPNNYYNNINMNNYIINKNYAPKINFNPYTQNVNSNIINNMNDNFYFNMNNLNNNNNLYMNNNNNIFQNPYLLNNKISNNINGFNPNFISQMPLQMNKNNNYFKDQENINNNNLFNNFYYNGDKYQISNSKEYKKKETGELHSINESDLVTAITINNKVIKRIDPNTYLNESIEYLSYNILPLAKDQAGCRFLQDKLVKEPNAANAFYKAILPHLLTLVKDPFGNYLVQKLCNYLDEEGIKKIIETISPNILEIGSNSHGTRVIQHLINFLSNPNLVEEFFKILKPHVIPLLKELNGTHIINKLITVHPECANNINKIIVENSSTLATHRHGCCILQKLLDGPDKNLKNDLIDNLVENCNLLIVDQFGNYVIQSILLLNNVKASGAIALKICNDLQYYSKHRYSSNVIEKCFDYCGKKEKNILVQKICSPEIIADLILDEHGNYVVQKALFYAEQKEKEFILQNIVMLLPKIKHAPFGEKLLNRLIINYPILNNYIYNNFNLPELFQNLSLDNNPMKMNMNMNNNNYYQKNKKKKTKNKKNNKKNVNNNNNNENNANENIFFNNSNQFINNSNNNFLNNNINVNNNITINNYNNINNNQIDLNQNPNNNPENPSINYMNFNENMLGNNFNQNMNYIQRNMNNNENDNKKKAKKKRKNKNKKYSNESYNNESYDQYENNEKEENNESQKDN